MKKIVQFGKRYFLVPQFVTGLAVLATSALGPLLAPHLGNALSWIWSIVQNFQFWWLEDVAYFWANFSGVVNPILFLLMFLFVHKTLNNIAQTLSKLEEENKIELIRAPQIPWSVWERNKPGKPETQANWNAGEICRIPGKYLSEGPPPTIVTLKKGDRFPFIPSAYREGERVGTSWMIVSEIVELSVDEVGPPPSPIEQEDLPFTGDTCQISGEYRAIENPMLSLYMRKGMQFGKIGNTSGESINTHWELLEEIGDSEVDQ